MLAHAFAENDIITPTTRLVLSSMAMYKVPPLAFE